MQALNAKGKGIGNQMFSKTDIYRQENAQAGGQIFGQTDRRKQSTYSLDRLEFHSWAKR